MYDWMYMPCFQELPHIELEKLIGPAPWEVKRARVIRIGPSIVVALTFRCTTFIKVEIEVAFKFHIENTSFIISAYRIPKPNRTIPMQNGERMVIFDNPITVT